MIEKIKKFPRFGEFGFVSFCSDTDEWTYFQKGGGTTLIVARHVSCVLNSTVCGLAHVTSGFEPSLEDYRAAYDAAVEKYDEQAEAELTIRED